MVQQLFRQSTRSDPLKGNTRFTKIRELNSGAFGFVWLAYDNLAQCEVAIKFLPRGPRIDRNVEREILNHRNLLHHHVVQFKGVFLANTHLGIVLEYAPGGDLLDWIHARGGISEEVARWFFQQLIIGLDYIHRMGVANRDIKLENTLVDDKEWPLLKICDFGYSKHEKLNSAAKSFVGTKPYLAPEVITAGRNRTQYDGKKADIWSCGVLLYVIMFGAYPFDRQGDCRDEAVLKRIQNVDYKIHPGVISKQCEDLIKKILVKDPRKRPSIQEIQAHPWYQTSLPEGATDMNDLLVEQAEGVQTQEEITAVLRDARFTVDEL